MPSPFPGVDPLIEVGGVWPGFHLLLLSAFLEALNRQLPESYVALVEEEMRLVREPEGDIGRARPDVAVARDFTVPRPRAHGAGGVATLEPVTIPLAKGLTEEIREIWIEIRRLPELALVAVVELLSPTNKVGAGRIEYLEKRDAYIERPIHIIEIDLLIGGHRSPMKRPLPRGDFHAIVSRAERRPDAEVYSWSIRDRLPAIPVPLSVPDADVALDLGSTCATAYDRGRYNRLLRYREPLDLPLATEDRAWAEQLARGTPT